MTDFIAEVRNSKLLSWDDIQDVPGVYQEVGWPHDKYGILFESENEEESSVQGVIIDGDDIYGWPNVDIEEEEDEYRAEEKYIKINKNVRIILE